MAKIDLIQAYQQAFGYKGVPFFGLKTIPTVAEAASDSKIETVADASEKNGAFNRTSSIFGTPFFMPCKLDDFQLPNEPLVELKGSKTIIKTSIDGNEGTFKELWALNDSVIRIRGIATLENNSDEYPEQQVRAIRKLIEKKSAISVVNNFLGYLGVFNLVIEDYDFPAIEGAPGMQPYELICLSDNFFDLELLEGTV